MKEKKHISNLLILLIGLSSCSNQISTPIVKTRYEYSHVYQTNKHFGISKLRKNKTKIGYVKYAENGNEMEVGDYGEIWHFREVTTNPDSTITFVSGHGRHMKKLNTVTFKTYNPQNQIISEEYWRYKNNQKDYLIYRTEFQYLNGVLVGEIEYDSDGNVSRAMRYNADKTIQTNDKKRPFYEPIVRVEGNSKYEIKYDSLGREVEKFHYSNGKFLRRTVSVYKYNLKTIYIYDDSPDKLWSFTEEKYNYGTNKLLRRYWKVLDSPTERIEIFEYNRNDLLKRVLTYGIDSQSGKNKLESFTKYKYKYYKK
jgi:hypothetical protein